MARLKVCPHRLNSHPTYTTPPSTDESHRPRLTLPPPTVILIQGLRNSRQNSEDMEQLPEYSFTPLRSRALVTGFETLFEFLGLNFRSTEEELLFRTIPRLRFHPHNHSTIVNTIAYRAMLWISCCGRALARVQHAHLE